MLSSNILLIIEYEFHLSMQNIVLKQKVPDYPPQTHTNNTTRKAMIVQIDQLFEIDVFSSIKLMCFFMCFIQHQIDVFFVTCRV